MRPVVLAASVLAALSSILLYGCSGSSTPRAQTGSSTTVGASNSTSTSNSNNESPSTTTTAVAPDLSCALAPVSEVNSSLGLNVDSPSSQMNGSVTVCTYSGTPGPVIVRFQSGEDPSTFAAGKQSFAQNGETTDDVAGIGDGAYSSTSGSGQAQTNTLVVLKGTIELLVTAPVTLDDVSALVRQILPSI